MDSNFCRAGVMDDIELALFERGVEALEQIAKHLELMERRISGMSSPSGGGSAAYGGGGAGGGGINPRPRAEGGGGGGIIRRVQL